jgi:hypothetical protein
MKRRGVFAAAAILTILFAGVGSLTAQQGGGPGWGMGRGMHGPGWGRGMMGQEWGMGPGMRGPGMMGMGCPMMGYGDDGEMATFAEGRIAFLKAELEITDAQKGVWDGYAKALKSNLETMRSMHQLMRTTFEAKTPVERLDGHIAAMETRLNALKDMQPALSKLYEALSEKQRETANDVLTAMGCMM